MAVSGDKLELAIARSILGLTDDRVDIEFKWNDNMQENGNIMDFYVNGDTAPGRTLQLRLLHAVTPENNASPINGTAGRAPARAGRIVRIARLGDRRNALAEEK